MNSSPLAFFITFSCYGNWLHGHERGSVDREHNQYKTSFLPPNETLQVLSRNAQGDETYVMDEIDRDVVLKAIQEVCHFRQWQLLAIHVRSNHVHVVVQASAAPEKVMNDFKAYASRALNRLKPAEQGRKRWTRHGSTRYLWKDEEVDARIRYTIREQGTMMAWYLDPAWQARIFPESEPRPSGSGERDGDQSEPRT